MARGQQTRIEFPAKHQTRYINCTIWQPETKAKPWAVHCEGWMNSGIDVWLYHEDISRGYHFYRKCKFKSARQFAEFMRSQLTLFKHVFRKDLEIRGIDFRALKEGYEKGVIRAESHHIVNQQQER